MKNTFFLLFITAVMISCTTENQMPDREIFDAGGLKVITSSYNKKQAIMSVLYGNALALDNLINEKDRNLPGEIYKMVTWKQQPDPYWFDVNSNAEILSIETVTAVGSGNNVKLEYTIQQQKLLENKSASKLNERVHYITHQRPSIVPY